MATSPHRSSGAGQNQNVGIPVDGAVLADGARVDRAPLVQQVLVREAGVANVVHLIRVVGVEDQVHRVPVLQ